MRLSLYSAAHSLPVCDTVGLVLPDPNSHAVQLAFTRESRLTWASISPHKLYALDYVSAWRSRDTYVLEAPWTRSNVMRAWSPTDTRIRSYKFSQDVGSKVFWEAEKW